MTKDITRAAALPTLASWLAKTIVETVMANARKAVSHTLGKIGLLKKWQKD